ncbi:hypothetical protein B0T19DRAFT_64773 [Cercophora scortea]|uniref:Uncharacterized protein n=1 Tax=Cercophora scortea TaxID=314031 RepID=A0AAE0J620_9PEZI|nr:hypothetical protein B0T19DRAFT_64773 [Cercophora scortea]
MDHSAKAHQNNAWVMVDNQFTAEGHTKSRSPQYNGDNESSAQVASASSDDKYLYFLVGTDHTPESSNESSTVTGASGLTLGGGGGGGATGGSSSKAVATSYYHPKLTQSSLQQLQDEEDKAKYPAGGVADWAACAGTCRLNKHLVPSTRHSLVVRSKASTTSHASSQEWLHVPPPSSAIETIVAAGAWCEDDEYAAPYLYTSQSLTLEGE